MDRRMDQERMEDINQEAGTQPRSLGGALRRREEIKRRGNKSQLDLCESTRGYPAQRKS